MRTEDGPATERRALAVFEQLADAAEDTETRTRILAGETDAVRERLTALEASERAAAEALPTLIPGSADCDGELPPPERVDEFRLVRRIGRGGMGDVWLGERADGLFDQKVAVKLIQRHALARAADAFAAERRFLARLEHPAIARIIDGGVTDDGLPWLATEYVDGRTADEAAAELPIADRVALVRAAAVGVQAAHARLIAHGDIKPGNIMVARDGQVKLLDFGIARLIGDESAGPAAPLTPAFASPERRAGAPPSVADDVYALGRTLDTLVYGDRDPELDAIVRCATAPEGKRYGSAEALIADLDRWRGQLPLKAMPDRAGYRMRKFVARHNLGVVATALALLVLAAAALFANLNYRRAERERVVAASRFADAHRAAHYLMFDLVDRLERRPGTLALRAQIGRVAQGYLDRLSRMPEAPLNVKLDAVNGYLRAAATAGIGNAPNFGDLAQGKRDLERAQQMLRSLADTPSVRPALVQPTARAAALACQTQLYGDHDAPSALAIARRGAADVARLAAPAERREASWPLRLCEGDALVWLERPREAIALLSGELAAARARDPAPDPLTLARNLRFLGEAYYYDRDYPDAERVLVQSLAVLAREHARAPFLRVTLEFAGVADDLADTRILRRDYRGALAVAQQGYNLATAQAALDPDDVQSRRRALSLARLVADALARLGRTDEAIALMNDVAARWEALVRRYPDDAALARLRVMSMRVRGDLSRHAGERADACRLYAEADQGWRAFGRRWRISPSDLGEDVARVRRDLAACAGRGSFWEE